MNNPSKWDDLRIVLAIAAAGSLSGAGRSLEMSHSTVFRRIAEIEARLGVKLFDRGRNGYVPTMAGEEIAAAARRIEAQVLEAERRVAGQDLRPSGTVRVTTTDTLCFGLLSPVFAAFCERQPDIALEVAIANELFNLSKREADVAIRPCSTPPETLVGLKVATIAQAVYGRRDLVPASLGEFDIGAVNWIGPDERMHYRPLEQWMTAQGLSGLCRYRVDSVLGMLTAVRDGMGIAVLPCYLCDGDERLARLGETLPALATDLWLLTHEDLRGVARIRAFLDFVAQAIKQERSRLLGRP